MSRSTERHDGTMTEDTVVPVGDLVGRVVWTEAGERVGVVRSLDSDESGKIEALHVRDRWLLGQHQIVPAAGMRLDGNDVIVASAGTRREYDRSRDTERELFANAPQRPAGTPLLLAGREGVRGRFGGLDLLASFFGALATLGSLLVIGGLLAAIFGTGAVELDTSLASANDLTSTSLLVGGAAVLIASLLGGWSTGRGARYDGPGNALVSVVWVLAIAVVIGVTAGWAGNEYDVLTTAGLPTVVNDELALWGVIGVLAYIALMLIGAAIGGLLGESWHRRADRAMLDVMTVDGRASGSVSSAGVVGSPVAPQPFVDDRTVVEPDASSEREFHD